jgi:hypothetical protein
MALNPLVDQRARTLRATPIKGSKEIHHTFAFVQYHVQFYGQVQVYDFCFVIWESD